MRSMQFYCKNKDCPAYRNSSFIDWDGTSKFKCQSNLPNCERDYLIPVPGPEKGWKKLLKPKAIVLEAMVLALLAWWLVSQPGASKPTPPAAPIDVTIAIDGGVFLNALMVYTPQWIAEAAAPVEPDAPISFGLWAFRPIEPDGTKKEDLRNLTPSLQTHKDFKNLRIAGAPDPADIYEKVSISYDLFSGLKKVIEQNPWDSSSNRFLIVITASSGLPKNDPANQFHYDENDVKKFGDNRNVTIYTIQVNISLQVIREDQNTTKKQLSTLSSNKPERGPYEVTTSAKGEANIRLVSNYEAGVRAAFKEIMDQIKNTRKPAIASAK